MNTLQRNLRELLRYPSALFGLVIILALVGLAIYTVVTIPYDEAIHLWRGGEEIWHENPKNAQPEWVNYFRKDKLAKTLVMDSQAGTALKESKEAGDGMRDTTISFPIDYEYATFPQELTLYFTTKFKEKAPYISITWLTPDGREVRIGDFSVSQAQTYRFSQDEKLTRRLKGLPPQEGLFAAALEEGADEETPRVPLQGHYELKVSGLTFEPEAEVDAKLVMYGQVYGLAGTDHRRRDLMVALLWGTPVALAFGLLAALGTTLTTMIIAAISVWYGGWVDAAIQRLNEISLILPFLPILVLVGTLYSRSIWLMLGMSILLSIFGAAVMAYRAIFLQVKESPYIEAARAYGASNSRIIFSYMIPRIIPVLIPQLVRVIPTFVFLEATLAVLGLGDPVLPTWGKLIDDARANGALFQGQYYWVLEPSALLMTAGLAFAMVGFALDRIFNPRLREI